MTDYCAIVGIHLKKLRSSRLEKSSSAMRGRIANLPIFESSFFIDLINGVMPCKGRTLTGAAHLLWRLLENQVHQDPSYANRLNARGSARRWLTYLVILIIRAPHCTCVLYTKIYLTNYRSFARLDNTKIA